MKKSVGAIFFDRDGTLIKDKGYLSDPSGVELFPGVGQALARLREAGLLLFLFTNQSGINRGWFDLQAVELCHRTMIEKMGLVGGFDDVCIAPETPDETPVYRKPSPRFIVETIDRFQLVPQECWMVGDKPSDWGAGERASVRVAGIQPETGGSSPAEAKSQSIKMFSSVVEFVEWYLQNKSSK